MRRRAGGCVLLGFTLVLLGLSGHRLWQDARAFMDAPNRQAALKAGDGIVPETLRQRINQALARQDFVTASRALKTLQHLYPNDVSVELQVIYGRMMRLRSIGGLTAEKRAAITRDIRKVMSRAGNNPVLLRRAERMLAQMISAAAAQPGGSLPTFAGQVPPREGLPDSPP
ncbi:hypothetical protein [Thalassospira profundimaris]|uniref:hypothetical protein n=1 Tax=Thalassospira profundimaris TaxID=502049 RepID=UPI000DED709E|nr:hypothetical protein [Thalassospira profundimaris]